MDKKIPQRNGISCKNLKHFSYYRKKKKPETRSAMKRWKIPLELKCEEKKFNGAAKEILAHVEWHYMWATNLKLAYICLGRL